MPSKKFVQDIVPNQRRSIRNIPIEHEVERLIVVEKDKPEPEPVFVKIPPTRKKKNSSGKYFLSFLVIFVCVAVIGIALSSSYSKAVVTIKPKVTEFEINGTFTAKKNAVVPDLSYEVVTLSDEIRETVPASKGPAVETKAKGTVYLYNNYSTSAQTLIAGTRLAGTNGLIYRTSGSVSIPGRTSAGPGKIEVTVTADKAGAEYNASISDIKSDLKVVAFKDKDNERYENFYARLTSDITGGFSGNSTIIEKELKESTMKSMEQKLIASLRMKLEDEIPEDYIFYDQASTIVFDTPEPEISGTANAEIIMKGTLHAAIFKADNLIRFIAGDEIKKFPSDTYMIDGDEELQFNVSNSKDFSVQRGTPLIFTLKGPISIVGTFSEEKLKDELKGISLQESNNVFGEYASITNAQTSLTPFWMRSFPSSVDKIFIEYKPIE